MFFSFNIRDQVSDPYKTSGTRRQKDFSDAVGKNGWKAIAAIFQLPCTGYTTGDWSTSPPVERLYKEKWLAVPSETTYN
jgi:hypothetical protein